MPIVLTRIDDRLVHGQVVEGWLRVINADFILVVSDDVAQDKMQQTLMTMAVPSNVNVECYSIQDAADKVKEGRFKNKNVLALFSSPKDVLNFIKNGVKILSVNVGGMHYITGKKQISKTLSVDKEDIDVLMEMGNMGIELEGRILPDDERTNIIDILKKNQEINNK